MSEKKIEYLHIAENFVPVGMLEPFTLRSVSAIEEIKKKYNM